MKTLFTCLFCVVIMSVQGSYLLGGYITYKPIGSPSSFTYEITVVQFANSQDGKAAHREELIVNFGDGTQDTVAGHLTKVHVTHGVWRNIYKTKHSFPGDGCYIISTPALSEFNDLKNVSGGAFPFQQSELCISSSLGKVNNSSPQLTHPFPFSGRTDSVYRFKPAFTEHDTDSLVLSPLHLGNGYKWPSEIEPFKNSYQVRNSELIWDKPNVPGRYLLAFRHEEYRTILTPEGDRVVEKIGYVLYWWIVEIEGPAKVTNPNSKAFSVSQEIGSLWISHSEIIEGDVMLFDMSGRKVSQASLTNGECLLSIRNTEKGVYMLVVNSGNGIQTKKLMLGQ